MTLQNVHLVCASTCENAPGLPGCRGRDQIMKADYRFRAAIIGLAACLVCIFAAPVALADAQTDLAISPQGACNGGLTFVITNSNATSSIHATVTQTNTASGTTTTLDLSFQPGEQKVLGCAPQTPAGNFQLIWQVQSAQYL